MVQKGGKKAVLSMDSFKAGLDRIRHFAKIIS
jgi:hypothetical protein